ncbi:GtrA family protein [Bacillus marinisedimentorum]|uniref:GtrA family protein n=1 Tax=Bacillus marinisedimentorum TaxID=1821260 RepID=UPI0007DF7576|nr:GtrA family protein [Bacillus marinisedimentorum]
MPARTRRKGPFQFMQFSAIGVMNAAVDIVSLNILLFLFPTKNDILLTVYNTTAYSLAVLNSYFFNSRLTFKHGKRTGGVKWKFVAQALVSLGISNLVFIGSIELLGAYTGLRIFIIHNISKALAMLLSFSASFFFMKYLVFTKLKKEV